MENFKFAISNTRFCKFFLRDVFFTAESATQLDPPLSPAELLVALHTIESKSDVKAVMKGQLCGNLGFLFDEEQEKAPEEIL